MKLKTFFFTYTVLEIPNLYSDVYNNSFVILRESWVWGVSDKYIGWKGLSNEPQEFTGYKPACRCLLKYLMK